MSKQCPHSLAEQDIVMTRGLCPLCQFAKVEELRTELCRCADEAWPDLTEFNELDAPGGYRAYVRRWGTLGVLDYDLTASRFMTIPGNVVPWLYEGMIVFCTDELHCKIVDRLRAEVAEAAKEIT